MSQQALINFEIPKSAPGPQSDDNNTRATGLRNFLKGEVITVDSDSDDDKHMNIAVPAIKRLNLPTHQKTLHRVPEGVHPSRIKNHTSKEDIDPTTWREQKMEQESANWAPTGNNKIPLPVNTSKTSRPPCSVLTSYGTGSNRNVPSQGPPKAPKAMISQSGKGRFNPTQGVKQPPGTTPRKSGAAKGNRSVDHLMGTPRRKKYIAARKLLLRKNNPSAVKNSGSSYPPSALPKVDTCRDIPVARHITPLRMQSPGHREKDARPAKPSTSQLSLPQLKINPRNKFNNLTPTVDYDPKHSAVRPQYALFRDSVTPDQDTAPWDKYVGVPQAPSKVAGTADISLEKGHQVHPTRLNHFNPRYSASPEPDRYLSPPTGVVSNDPTCRNVGVGSYKDGDIVGGGAGQVPATSRGRRMLEKMGYKPGVSLGRSGKEELELAVVTMKIGKRGLGAGPKGWAPEGRGVLATLPGPNSPVWTGNTTSVEKQDEVQSRLENSDQEIPEAKGIGSKSEPSKTIVQDNGGGIDSTNGGGTKERVVIIIDSDDDDDHEEQDIEEEEERVQEALPQETQQGRQQREQENEKVKKEDQDPVAMGESEVEYDPEDVEMGDTHDYVVNPPCHNPHFAQAGQASSTRLLHQNPGKRAPTCLNTEGQPVEEDVVDTNYFQFDGMVPRWKLPPFRYSSSSCRPTVPMQLLGLVIIERLEQVALVEIFHCISAFEEDYRLTDPAFNHVLAKSFLRVRDMFMRDPLLDVGQDICEGIVREEFGALLEYLETNSRGRRWRGK